MLKGKVFYLVGAFSVSRKEIVDEIERKGGQVSKTWTGKVTHLMKGEEDPEQGKLSVFDKAKEKEIPIVKENFLDQEVIPDAEVSSSEDESEEEIEAVPERKSPRKSPKKQPIVDESSEDEPKRAPKKKKSEFEFSKTPKKQKKLKKEKDPFAFRSESDEETYKVGRKQTKKPKSKSSKAISSSSSSAATSSKSKKSKTEKEVEKPMKDTNNDKEIEKKKEQKEEWVEEENKENYPPSEIKSSPPDDEKEPKSPKHSVQKVPAEEKALSGLCLVVTGSFPDLSQKEVTKILKQNGAQVLANINEKVTSCLVPDATDTAIATSIYKAAVKKGLKIMDWKQIKQQIE